jgi:hypothetical protein
VRRKAPTALGSIPVSCPAVAAAVTAPTMAIIGRVWTVVVMCAFTVVMIVSNTVAAVDN